VEDTLRRDVSNDREGKSGFTLALWTGGQQGENIALRILCGVYRMPFTNTCNMMLPYKGDLPRRILTFAQMDQLMKILIQSWDPDRAIVTSYDLSVQTQYDNQKRSWTGWFTYLKKSVDRFPTFDPPVEVEPINEGEGAIVKIGREVLSADNPSHVEQVIRVRDQLNERGLLD
jgi:hypothetical protein